MTGSDFQGDITERFPLTTLEVDGIRILSIESQVGDENPEDEDDLSKRCLT